MNGPQKICVLIMKNRAFKPEHKTDYNSIDPTPTIINSFRVTKSLTWPTIKIIKF